VNQFYAPDLAAKRRCDVSRDNGSADAFSGVDAIHGNVGMFVGVVQSVEDFGPDAPGGRRWRVTLRPSS
jgi:hypothetical protein